LRFTYISQVSWICAEVFLAGDVTEVFDLLIFNSNLFTLGKEILLVIYFLP